MCLLTLRGVLCQTHHSQWLFSQCCIKFVCINLLECKGHSWRPSWHCCCISYFSAASWQLTGIYWQNKLFRKASSVIGCPFEPVEVVGESRMTAKPLSILDSHPLQHTHWAEELGERLMQPKCVKVSQLILFLQLSDCTTNIALSKPSTGWILADKLLCSKNISLSKYWICIHFCTFTHAGT